jgi:hypothetical protein
MSKDTLPHAALIDAIGPKLDNVASYQQIDCTGEFQTLATELYGGNPFGENALAYCSNMPIGPVVEFVDRVLTQQDSRGTVPLKVAALDADDLIINHGAVFAEWCSKRSIVEDGTRLAYDGLREAVLQSPLDMIKQIPDTHQQDYVARVGKLRISQHVDAFENDVMTPVTPPLKALARLQHIDQLANNMNHDQAVDIAEVLGTSNKPIPHVLRTPGAATAVKAVLSGRGETLDCSEDGVWAAVAFVGMMSARQEAFYPGSLHKDRVTDNIEADFSDVSGIRIVKAVGRYFDAGEYHALRNFTHFNEQSARRSFGNSDAVLYQVERSAFPRGELIQGVESNVPYRLYLPLSI